MSSIDILSIHEVILKENQGKMKFDKNNELNILFNEILNSKNSSADVRQDIEEKIKLQKKEQCSSNFYFYLTHALPLIEKFTILKKSINKLQFFKDKNKKDDNKENIKELINDYIEIVEQYFPNVFNHLWEIEYDKENKENKEKKIKINKNCSNCQMEQDNFILSDNHFVCKNCGNVISITSDNLISFNDIERINIGSKYSYDRRVHFKDCVKRFQGKQNVNIPKNVFDEITNSFIKYQLIPENYMELDKSDVFKHVKREHIQLFLKELGYSKFYDDIVYIYHKITGNPIPDITHLENNLYNDFDTLVETYDQMFNDRKNFITNQYVLFQLLRKYNYNCNKEDFNFLKTNDRKYYHDLVCQKLFEKLGWNFKAIF